MMYYFAYGSNMSLSRIRKRVPSAESRGCHVLCGYDLRFHKHGMDDSAKCNAFFTANAEDLIYGVLFEIDPKEKNVLDEAEGLGQGYDEKLVSVRAPDGVEVNAMTYVATNINENLKPYSWYLNHVVVGAKEGSLPAQYIELKIASVVAAEDYDLERDARQRGIYV